MEIAELREQVCACGHVAAEHADTESAWGKGAQTEGACLHEGCECPGFTLEAS